MTQALPPAEQVGPAAVDAGTTIAAEETGIRDPEIAVASQWKLMWWAFKRHRLAMVGGIVTLFFYFVVLFGGFLAPYAKAHYSADHAYAPPQALRFGGEHGLYVNGLTSKQDPDTYELTWHVDKSQQIPVGFFVRGSEYRFLGFFTSDRHLIGPVDANSEQPMFLLGANKNGRDVLSQMIHGTAVSMTIGLVGIAISLVLSILLGGISGLLGGVADSIIQRLIEFLISLPSIPLWMALAASVPDGWGPLQRYFVIVLILSMIGWTGLAREIRGKFLAVREEEYISAATVDGASSMRLIFRHMLPQFTSHIIAGLSLSIPLMILAETSLSFLGLGLQAPVVSWGVLLQEAQNVRVVATAPWIMIPGVAVVIAVLALNFLGDGLRDAADPYKS